MRLRKAFLIACVMFMALPAFAAHSLADSGSAPGWSPDWGTAPVLTPPDNLNTPNSKMNITGTTAVSISCPPDMVDSPINWAMPAPCPMPRVSGANDTITDATTTGSVVGALDMHPQVNPAQLPHDGSMNAILVPNGAAILPNGDISFGTAIGHAMPPTPPGYWDNIDSMDLHTNMPML